MKLAKLMTAIVAGALLSAAAGVTSHSQTASSPASKALSRVTRLDITSRRAAFGGKSFGTVGSYEILQARGVAQEAKREARREQRDADEHAAKILRMRADAARSS